MPGVGIRFCQCYGLAATTVVVAAATVIVVIATAVATPGATAVAEQKDQDDDPANVTAAETIIVTHRNYLRKNSSRLFAAHSKIFPMWFLVQDATILVHPADACYTGTKEK